MNVDQSRVPAKPLYVALIGLLVIGILVWPSLFCLIPALVFGAFVSKHFFVVVMYTVGHLILDHISIIM